MIPSWIGVIVGLVGTVILFRGTVTTMLMFLLTCSLMSGSAALFLPALGGASMPPNYLAMCFMVARLLLPGAEQHGRELQTAIRSNVMLFVFVAYGVLTAPLLPRLFADTMEVVPLRAGKLRFLLETFPLAYTPQNITTAVYLIGTLLAGLAATVAGRQPATASRLVKWGAVIAGIHVYLGLSDMLLQGTPYTAFLSVLRNGTYAQLDQAYDGVARIKGIMPEASTYAAFGLSWFVFHFECWVRDVETRWTGPATGALGAVLLLSTSSSAYVGLVVYSFIFCLRCFIFPRTLTFSKFIRILAMLWGITTVTVVIMALSPNTTTRFFNMIQHFTLDKSDSDSGVQRAFWARQGVDAFLVSKGLGIGAGSFRSSSIVTAILGSMGVVGIVTFVGYLLAVVQPVRQSTFVSPNDLRHKVGAAASWTTLLTLVPAAINAPSPNPGIDFAIFGGLAIALRAGPVYSTILSRRRPAWPGSTRGLGGTI
jgi:hypothetical protein